MKFKGRHNDDTRARNLPEVSPDVSGCLVSSRKLSGWGQGFAGLAVAGIGIDELVKLAVQFLIARGDADRIGVWMESVEPGRLRRHVIAGFRGMVADRDGETTPAEWEGLSPEAPLPLELLREGKSVEEALNGDAGQPIFGVLVGIRRVVWVPVAGRGRLRGLIFAGSRKKRGSLPVKLLESVSAELALAVELQEERRLAQERHEDLTVIQRVLAELAHSGPTDAVLADLLDSYTGGAPEAAGAGALFAALRRHGDATPGFAIASGEGEPELPACSANVLTSANKLSGEGSVRSWQSGDPAWLQAIESQPLASLWQRAREARGPVVTIETVPGMATPRGDVPRVVAIGLEAAGESVGVFVAGIPHSSCRAWAVERLELRAALATVALVLRRREDEARSHRARQEVLLRASSAAVVLVDGAGLIAGESQGARELLNNPPNEARSEWRCAAGDDSRSESPTFAGLFRLREQPRVETWLERGRASTLREDDTEEPPEVQLRNDTRVRLRRLQPGGGLAAVLLEPPAAHDAATRRGRAEVELFNVLEWLEEGVVLFDAHQGIRAMNSRFAQMGGLAPEETGRLTTLGALIARLSQHAAEPEKFAKRWRDLARGENSGVREEIQFVRPVPRVLERAARPVVDAVGNRLGRVEIYRDLTAQRVFQSKLLQTEKLAALGEMVTGVAHELSNPLTSILGYAQRLFLRDDGEGKSDEVRQIFQEAERAGTILRQLLMSARESRPERRRISLNHLVSRTMDLQKFNLASEKVAVELDLDVAQPVVLGDAGQLQQVLTNLIGNARQAIEQRGRGGTIRLRTKRRGHRVRLEVTDNGPGIPHAIAARIFDPFFTTKPAGIGTGLGLAIVLGIVQEHGGQVKVASPPGGGAMFSLDFPAAPAEESRPPALPATGPGGAPRPAPRPTDTSGLAPWSGTRVLVVEDEPTVARLIGDVLEDEGFYVDALLDGHEALEQAARETYDLVICDMKMPGLDGQHFYRTLVDSGNPLGKRFLFVTGDIVAAHTQEFLERHQLPHVAKPFRVEELTEKVRRVLADATPWDGASELPARTNAARK